MGGRVDWREWGRNSEQCLSVAYQYNSWVMTPILKAKSDSVDSRILRRIVHLVHSGESPADAGSSVEVAPGRSRSLPAWLTVHAESLGLQKRAGMMW